MAEQPKRAYEGPKILTLLSTQLQKQNGHVTLEDYLVSVAQSLKEKIRKNDLNLVLEPSVYSAYDSKVSREYLSTMIHLTNLKSGVCIMS